jgi:hypothetical protein
MSTLLAKIRYASPPERKNRKEKVKNTSDIGTFWLVARVF